MENPGSLHTSGSSLRIVALVVTYQRPDELQRVIESLMSQTRIPDHIIVFDNGGTERAAQTLQGFRGPLEILLSERNLGGAGGFASGLSHALALGADWVWLLDDDAIPDHNALEKLLKALPGLPSNTGALGGAVREYGDCAVRHRRHFSRLTGWEWSLGRSRYGKGCSEMDVGSFVGFMVSGEAARQIDLPEAGFFTSYDDTDYSLRLQNSGWRLWLVPDSIVNHLRMPASRLSRSPFGLKHYYNIRNRLIIKRRHSRVKTLATLNGVAYAWALWLVADGWKRRDRLNLLLQAISDGLAGRLGMITPDGPVGS